MPSRTLVSRPVSGKLLGHSGAQGGLRYPTNGTATNGIVPLSSAMAALRAAFAPCSRVALETLALW